MNLKKEAPTSADREKGDGTVYTWKYYGDKVFEITLRSHRSAFIIIAVNDYCGNDVINVKDGERQKRSASIVGGQTKNVVPAKERHFPGIKEFNSFFQNPLNKIHLQAFLKSHFALKCKQINIRFIYHKRNNCQDISSSLLKSSVKKFCCFHLEADTVMFFLYSRIREYDQTTPVLINSEDIDIVVMCAYAASIINGERAIRCKRNNFSAKELCSKEISKIIVPLRVITGCDVMSSFFGVGKRTVWKRVQKSTEAQMFLTNLSHENLNKFVIKYIYDDKVSTTLTQMRAQKWKNIKNGKAKAFARIGPDVDSNFHRNERVMYYAHLLLNFQNPAVPLCPINHGYQILNGLCMPIMHSKSPLPDELVKRVNHNLQADNTDPEDNDDDYSSDEDEFDDELSI